MTNFSWFQNEILSKLRSEIFPKFIGILEKLLRENSSNSGYFVGESVSKFIRYLLKWQTVQTIIILLKEQFGVDLLCTGMSAWI